MKYHQGYRKTVGIGLKGLLLAIAMQGDPQVAFAQLSTVILLPGFAPNPTVLTGIGGGELPAADVVEHRQTPTGLCLGYISPTPHVELTLANRFSNLEMGVKSDLDTTLIVRGPGGVWCNDDSQDKNPLIVGEWLPGNYQVWVGAYHAEDTPDYELSIRDRS